MIMKMLPWFSEYLKSICFDSMENPILNLLYANSHSYFVSITNENDKFAIGIKFFELRERERMHSSYERKRIHSFCTQHTDITIPSATCARNRIYASYALSPNPESCAIKEYSRICKHLNSTSNQTIESSLLLFGIPCEKCWIWFDVVLSHALLISIYLSLYVKIHHFIHTLNMYWQFFNELRRGDESQFTFWVVLELQTHKMRAGMSAGCPPWLT